MIKRFNPDFSLSISHELAYMRETPEGGYVAHGDYATLFSELEVVKAERDALAVENGQLREMNSSLCAELQEYESDNDDFGPAPQSVVNCFALLTPNTDAALAAIEARFCGLLDTYGKVEPERFSPEFADLYAKIVNRIFSSVLDNPSVTDLESLTDWLENSSENARAYADMSIKFRDELRGAK
ncbi:hypothetical protein [Serratia liquefaciens]|uniref:hypothetical protein n=1 Tax=Serratia liquefaciens TaxID=614 RepID=UPI0022B9C772|nr:hypothetical protein [Serratia liquefaciens]